MPRTELPLHHYKTCIKQWCSSPPEHFSTALSADSHWLSKRGVSYMTASSSHRSLQLLMTSWTFLWASSVACLSDVIQLIITQVSGGLQSILRHTQHVEQMQVRLSLPSQTEQTGYMSVYSSQRASAYRPVVAVYSVTRWTGCGKCAAALRLNVILFHWTNNHTKPNVGSQIFNYILSHNH